MSPSPLELPRDFRQLEKQLEKMWRLFSTFAILRSELERDPAALKVRTKVAEATIVSRSVEIAAINNQAAHRMSAVHQTKNPHKLSFIFDPFGGPCEFEHRAATLLIGSFA
ncbi:MAG: hypothetical protein WCB53_04440, partial [Terriglobales bacterium]